MGLSNVNLSKVEYVLVLIDMTYVLVKDGCHGKVRSKTSYVEVEAELGKQDLGLKCQTSLSLEVLVKSI